jgi:septal ring factor EnvC (AmiA/AmiB activator)
MRKFVFLAVVVLSAPLIAGCQAAMYSALESIGIEKRDVLVKRVSDARDAQESAKDQFASALDQFRSVVKVDGGELERTYDRLNSEYERSRTRAEAVAARIDAVEQVAEDLFADWVDELDEYSDASLRRDSERLLNDTKRRYAVLIKTMQRAESSMDPVLEIFQDQVLALKHNLNAQAIGSLRNELASIEKQTAALMKDMERSIAEANQFITSMKTR